MPDRAPRILIIDDEPDSVRLLLDYLAGHHADLMVALDARDGLAKARAGQPDLILLDITMPGENGFAVCGQLKSDPCTEAIPVIFLSALSDTQDKLQGFEVGGIDYITKPFSGEEVVTRVFVQLANRRRFQQLEAMATQRTVERLPTKLQDRDGWAFRRACAILDEQLASAPDLAQVARELGMPERRLNELFRDKVGLSLFDYTLELRLGSARRLLESSGLQVQQIADRVGYLNAGDLTRAFRRRYGVSPRQYRQSRNGTSELLGE